MKIIGKIKLNGDKSISHRALIVASLCKGVSILRNIPTSLDIKTTISCLRQCGIRIEENSAVKVEGGKFKIPRLALDCGNSGTTMRLLIGALAANNIKATLIGDKSLSRRPMDRIIEPLSQMGVEIISNNGKAPLTISKINLQPIKYNISLPSAQVKSCLMLASLGVKNNCEISGMVNTRNHLELILEELSGKKIIGQNGEIVVGEGIINKLKGFKYNIPGDISSASFLIALAVLCKDSKLVINDLSLNNYRLGFINTLLKMGADIQVKQIKTELGETVGTIKVCGGRELSPCIISKSDVVDMIDEIPILSLVCAHINNQSIIMGLEELKVKESNRFEGIINILSSMGVDVVERENSIIINGEKRLYNTNKLNDYNDHRLSMMICIAQLLSNQKPIFSSCINVSFPSFKETIKGIIKE